MAAYEPAEYYDEHYARETKPSPEMTVIHHEVASLVLASRPLVIWDFGCGPGWMASTLRRHSGRYIGVDFSEVAIRQARERLRNWAEFEFRVGDLREPQPMRDASSVLLFAEVLEHLEDDVGTFRSIARVGDRVVISVPCYECRSHVRWFREDEDIGARYGVEGEQFTKDRQIYLSGVVVEIG